MVLIAQSSSPPQVHSPSCALPGRPSGRWPAQGDIWPPTKRPACVGWAERKRVRSACLKHEWMNGRTLEFLAFHWPRKSILAAAQNGSWRPVSYRRQSETCQMLAASWPAPLFRAPVLVWRPSCASKRNPVGGRAAGRARFSGGQELRGACSWRLEGQVGALQSVVAGPTGLAANARPLNCNSWPPARPKQWQKRRPQLERWRQWAMTMAMAALH